MLMIAAVLFFFSILFGSCFGCGATRHYLLDLESKRGVNRQRELDVAYVFCARVFLITLGFYVAGCVALYLSWRSMTS